MAFEIASRFLVSDVLTPRNLTSRCPAPALRSGNVAHDRPRRHGRILRVGRAPAPPGSPGEASDRGDKHGPRLAGRGDDSLVRGAALRGALGTAARHRISALPTGDPDPARFRPLSARIPQGDGGA